MWIKKGDGREKNICFSTFEACVIVIETILLEILSKEPPHPGIVKGFQYDSGDLTHKSFLGKKCSCEEVRKALRFVSVAAVEVMSGNSLLPTMIAITIFNMDGKKLLNGIVTHRNPVKHFKRVSS